AWYEGGGGVGRWVGGGGGVGSVGRSKPSTLPSPKVGEMAVAIKRSSVVFPEPFQPRSQTVSPWATARLTWLTAARPSNNLVTLDKRTAARWAVVTGAS